MRNDEYSRPPNPHRLYRSRNKSVCGVASGFAEYFNVDTTLIRILWVLSFFILGPISFIAYFVACILMPVRDAKPQTMKPEEDSFWRGVERQPSTTFSNLRYQFRDMEERLADLERSVTSKEWKLRRQFRDLEG